MRTPEGKIKDLVNNMLELVAQHKSLWYFCPVQAGFGKPALDYIGCCNGKSFAVEAKAPGEDLTRFQRITARQLYEAGSKVFIVSSAEGVQALGRWLQHA